MGMEAQLQQSRWNVEFREILRNSGRFPKPGEATQQAAPVTGFAKFANQASVGRSDAVVGLFVGELAQDFSFESSFIFFGLNDCLVFVTFHGRCPRRFDNLSIIVDTREKDVTGPELLFVIGSTAAVAITMQTGNQGPTLYAVGSPS